MVARAGSSSSSPASSRSVSWVLRRNDATFCGTWGCVRTSRRAARNSSSNALASVRAFCSTSCAFSRALPSATLFFSSNSRSSCCSRRAVSSASRRARTAAVRSRSSARRAPSACYRSLDGLWGFPHQLPRTCDERFRESQALCDSQRITAARQSA